LIYATGVAAQRAHFSPMPKCCWTKSTGRLSLADAALHFWEADENSINHIAHTHNRLVVGLFARGDVHRGCICCPWQVKSPQRAAFWDQLYGWVGYRVG